MINVEDKVRELVEEIISDQDGLFLVDIQLKGHQGSQHLLITLDGDKGVQIEQCAKVSRKVGYEIEESEIIGGKYQLEVSSAGMGSPLKMLRQYVKNIGRGLDVKLMDGTKLTGDLLKAEDDGIALEIDGENREISFKEIDKSKVVVSFK